MIGLWEYKSHPTKFCLCVDNFCIKFWSKDDAQYLCNAIGTNFKYTVDSEEKHYYGLTLDWHYNLGFVDISMPKYVWDILKKLK